jgi:hypothetical protein
MLPEFFRDKTYKNEELNLGIEFAWFRKILHCSWLLQAGVLHPPVDDCTAQMNFLTSKFLFF